MIAFKTSPAFVDHLWEVFCPLLAAPAAPPAPPPATAALPHATPDAAGAKPGAQDTPTAPPGGQQPGSRPGGSSTAPGVSLVVFEGDDLALDARGFVCALVEQRVTHLVGWVVRPHAALPTDPTPFLNAW